MAQVFPAERDLRRVIGDADGAGDREVEGLGEQELLDLYRSMVLLRTYDERSVVYHRQGRIGTYAIFWNHEAMQVGSVHALEDGDWIFPSYRESAIGLLRGMPPSTVLSWWRGHPAGWWDPRDYNIASICVPIGTHVAHAAGFAWGKKLRGDGTIAVVERAHGADLHRLVPPEDGVGADASLAVIDERALVVGPQQDQRAVEVEQKSLVDAVELAIRRVAVADDAPQVALGRDDLCHCAKSSDATVRPTRPGARRRDERSSPTRAARRQCRAPS